MLFPSLLDSDIDEHKDYVLCELSPDGKCPPRPLKRTSKNLNYNDAVFIKLPHSEVVLEKFETVKEAIAQFTSYGGCLTIHHVKEVFDKISDGERPVVGLEAYYETRVARLEVDDRSGFNAASRSFDKAMRMIAHFVSRTDDYLTEAIPFLDNSVRSITLSLDQCSCLLALAFMGLLPGRNRRIQNLQPFDFVEFLASGDRKLQEKIAFILNFFEKISDNGGSRQGCVTFSRRAIHEKDIPDWRGSSVKLSSMTVSHDRLIEDELNSIHVDFANKFIGGGVLRRGAVQEEIRFLCCPDMIVSMLIAPRMRDNECILITGAPTVSRSKGYAASLTFDPSPPSEDLKMDRFGRLENETVAIDATSFGGDSNKQYLKEFIDRELKKAFVGFYNHFQEENPKAVSTGNWGCGAFRGDLYFKSIIQLMAASVNKRSVLYHTFGNEDAKKRLEHMWSIADREERTVGDLYDILLTFHQAKVDHHITHFYDWFVKCVTDNMSDSPSKNRASPP